MRFLLHYYNKHWECRITVFPRVVAAATNVFTLQEAAATIRGRLLNEGGV